MKMIVRVEAHPRSRASGVFRAGRARVEDAFGVARREFPTLDFGPGRASEEDALLVAEEQWEGKSFDFYRFDDQVDRASVRIGTTVRLLGSATWIEEQAASVLTRCQRAIDRRNAASDTPLFERALERVRTVYDRSKPLGLADYRHALDCWHWILRLDRHAGLEVQLAALFHDVERSVSEADRRVEHEARDYAEFKDAHAREGAEITRRILSDVAAPPSVALRVCSLVRLHESTSDDHERALVNDADALSFFSLNSNGFMDYFGEAHTRRKVRYTLGRLRSSSRARIPTVRMRADIAKIVAEELPH